MAPVTIADLEHVVVIVVTVAEGSDDETLSG
jgi:hypothetical protein